MISDLKKRFPIFERNPNLVFFDTAASALKVDSMINAITECYSYQYANIHRGIYDLSSKLTKRYEDARLAVGKFIDSPSSNNIIFTKSATEGINLVSSCLSSNYFEDGDMILKLVFSNLNELKNHLKDLEVISTEKDNGDKDVWEGLFSLLR